MNHNIPGSGQEPARPQAAESTGSGAAETVGEGGKTDREEGPIHLQQGYLAQLAERIERIETRLDRLLAEAEASGSQVASLTHHLTDLDATRAVEKWLAELVTRLESGQEQLHELADTVAKSSRTQFKANTLAESKEQRLEAVVATLQEIVTRREAVQAAREAEGRHRLAEARLAARGELAADLLPVLDGLELALESGRALVEKHRQPEAAAARRSAAELPPRGRWQRLRNTLAGRFLVVIESPRPATSAADMVSALAAWLRGLELVRGRFLRLLAAEAVEVIAAQGQPFDPHQHVAVESELRTDVAAHTVTRVLRKGYRQRGRVLRHAEVVVSRMPSAATDASGEADG